MVLLGIKTHSFTFWLRYAVSKAVKKMADFTDEEDILLMQVADQTMRKNGNHNWKAIAHAMRETRKSSRKLKRRYFTLQRTYGRDFSKLPMCLRKMMDARLSAGSDLHNREKETLIALMKLSGNLFVDQC